MSAIPRALAAALAVAGVLGIAARAQAQARPSRAEVARVVDSLARQFITDHARGAPAVSIAVVRGTDTLVMNGWGRADIENDVPATAPTSLNAITNPERPPLQSGSEETPNETSISLRL